MKKYLIAYRYHHPLWRRPVTSNDFVTMDCLIESEIDRIKGGILYELNSGFDYGFHVSEIVILNIIELEG